MAPRDDEDDMLRGAIDRLPKDRPLERDLWPDIAGRIRDESRGARARQRVTAIAAASVALAAGVTSVVELHSRENLPAAVSSAEAPRPSAPGARVRLPGEVEYEGAERVLATELARRRAVMTPEQAAVIDDNLRIVDEAIASTREALQRDPDDAELRAELDRTWDEKLDLLTLASEFPSEHLK